jgi:hypothetical protein
VVLVWGGGGGVGDLLFPWDRWGPRGAACRQDGETYLPRWYPSNICGCVKAVETTKRCCGRFETSLLGDSQVCKAATTQLRLPPPFFSFFRWNCCSRVHKFITVPFHEK